MLAIISLSLLSDAEVSSQTAKINQAACDLAKAVAKEGGVYFAGCINQTAFLYSQGVGNDVVMKKFREQIEIFLQNNVDLIVAEVSCLKLHLNFSVLISALELAAATLTFYYFPTIYGQNSFNLLHAIQDYSRRRQEMSA